ncbi:STAS/SEC14 domain-containing protein [Chitinophaga sedimenti]|uniref:STAS/SEC14 domain-containing protein n=1 Tax=Chitinophaga sedimenti TaxID=2033606 RepID=UPI00200318FE|nr:STAS/SEC14 domain-containing protein [Chitinophaga sedimenti]MCK7556627.1 STAS/SEC14 domain-containing protein [Chitinophaga sedimenti]
MITQLSNVPSNIVAFRASGEVTKDDFETDVLPAVHELVKRTGKLNYLMIIDTDLKNFTGGAWAQDMLLGIKQLTKWHRAAILTDSDNINTFTDAFSYLVPGEFKGFKKDELDAAVAWVSAEN